MTGPRVDWSGWSVVRLLLAVVAVACGLVVLVGNPHDPANVLAVAVIFAALAAVVP